MPSPESKLSVPNAGSRIVNFPANLGQDNIARYMSFTAVQIDKTNREDAAPTKYLDTVALPIPSNLMEMFNSNWSDDALMALQDLAYGDRAKWAWQAVAKAARNAAGAAASTLAGTDEDVGARGLNIIENPRLANQFVSQNLKDHQFQFYLLAKSAKESQAIADIIHFFRYYSAGDLSHGGALLDEPNRFLVKFYPNEEFLFQPGVCSLVAMNVNYNGSTSRPAFFEETGAPVEIYLDITMRSSRVEYKKVLDELYKRRGWDPKSA